MVLAHLIFQKLKYRTILAKYCPEYHFCKTLPTTALKIKLRDRSQVSFLRYHKMDCRSQCAPNTFSSIPSSDSVHPEKATSSRIDSVPKLASHQANFCRLCGSKLQAAIPPGDREMRLLCESCGYIDYVNPKMVVGCIVEHDGKILLARRAIEPCKGLWTVPAGYMEMNESSQEGAIRETLEEVNAHVKVLAPYAHWDIPAIGQAYILFRASLSAPHTFSPGPESLEVALFNTEDIPYESIAFSSISISLRLFVEDMQSGIFRFHHGVIEKKHGSLPNAPGTYVLRDHTALKLA